MEQVRGIAPVCGQGGLGSDSPPDCHSPPRRSIPFFAQKNGFAVTNPKFYKKNGAGEGNRTPVASLEGWSSTIELHLLVNYLTIIIHFQTIVKGEIANFL